MSRGVRCADTALSLLGSDGVNNDTDFLDEVGVLADTLLPLCWRLLADVFLVSSMSESFSSDDEEWHAPASKLASSSSLVSHSGPVLICGQAGFSSRLSLRLLRGVGLALLLAKTSSSLSSTLNESDPKMLLSFRPERENLGLFGMALQ